MTLEFTNLSDYKKQKYWKSIHARISNKKKNARTYCTTNITYLYASQLRDWTIIFILKRYLKGNFEVDNKDKKN